MLRKVMHVAVWMVLGAVATATAQEEPPPPAECSGTYEATSLGLRGGFHQLFVFEENSSGGTLQTGSLVITTVDERSPAIPDLTGTWLAVDRCQFSIWTISTNEGSGRASGSGLTLGDQLIGVYTVNGFPEAANGFYIVTGQQAAEVPEEPEEPEVPEEPEPEVPPEPMVAAE